MASLLATGANREPGRGRPHRTAGISRAIAAAAALLALVFPSLSLSGCAGDAADIGPGAHEQLGYVVQKGQRSHVMLTTTAGGEGESFLEWPGFGERFSFSGDGRYFTLVLWGTETGPEGHARTVIVSTDGASAWTVPGDAIRPTFSPDSRAVAYYTIARTGPGSSTVALYDIASGTSMTLARGDELENPVWVDGNSLVYGEGATGVIYRLDTRTGATAPLTPPERRFSSYTFPVSLEQKRIALTEDGPLHNIWSLDLEDGRLTQVTNNSRLQFRAGYLPGTDTILFEEQASELDRESSELAFIDDDGGDFSFLTRNYFFDGLQTISTSSGRIAWQYARYGRNSIRVGYPGSNDAATIVSGADWVGDPNFLRVPSWSGANPLEMSVETGAPGPEGNPLKVRVSNPGGEAVEATLRSFAGLDLELSQTGGRSLEEVLAGAGGGTAAPGASGKTWRLSLEPRESLELTLTARVRPTVMAPQEATILVTLAVPDTPPRMFWQDLG